MSTTPARSRILPWAGWVLGPLAWATDHQGGSNWSFASQHCSTISGPIVAIGLACGLVAAAGAALSWVSRPKGARESEENVRAFIAWVGAMGSAVFLLAILYSTFAGLMIPPCLA